MRDAYLSLAFWLFPLGMFFGASYLGDLSDALNRRRTLLICMAGLASAYVLMWLAGGLLGTQEGSQAPDLELAPAHRDLSTGDPPSRYRQDRPLLG